MSDHVLTIERTLTASVDRIWRCWTEPELIRQWFTPAPWKTVEVTQDLRPGGASMIVMENPDGERFPNPGQFVEIVPQERLVFTDAFIGDWVPSEKPFMVGTITMSGDGNGRTNYRAEARHWSAEDRKAHEEMGFHAGWNAAADQLEALAKTL